MYSCVFSCTHSRDVSARAMAVEDQERLDLVINTKFSKEFIKRVLKEKLPTVVGGDGVPRKGYKVAIKMVPTIFQGIMKLFVGEITERGW